MLRFKKKHQSFKYVPRFYDPDKEKIQKRVEAMRKANEHSIEGMKARISRGMGASTEGSRKFKKKQILKSNYIVLGVLLILVVLFMLFLQHYLPRILEVFG
jgi:hypothetical protein